MHYDRGMANSNAHRTLENMVQRGISKETITTFEYAGLNIERWLHGFDNVTDRRKK